MERQCGSCVCSSPQSGTGGGRLVLATDVSHTATTLRGVALRRGQRLRPLAPGLLELQGDGLDDFLLASRTSLSSVEADEVRCLIADASLPDSALLRQAMTAPTLSRVGARVAHADLLPLFQDEHASFHSVYQPIVRLDDRAVIGHEALLRAVDPTGEPVFPDVLFPAAEAAGWTGVLDRVGRTTALHDAGPWLGSDLLFINFVPTSIYRPEVCLRTTEIAAAQAGLALDQLVFEVTEGHRVRDLDHLADVFAYYRDRGCRVALDDLGAGYSSLNMLVRLQPDVVKLDKDIVQALPDPAAAAVVAAIVSITHAYGGLVLAECVETAVQADAARELGVDLGQGWHFGRPVRPDLPEDRRTRPPVLSPDRPDAAVAVVEPTLDSVIVEGLMERAVASSSSGVVVVDMVDPLQPILSVNAAFERMSGLSAAEVVGQNCRIMQGPDTDRAAVEQIAAAVRSGVEHSSVLLNYRPDGSTWWNELYLSPVRDDAGRLTHYLGFQHDVSARVKAERALQHLSEHDALTGLLNRAALLRHLERAADSGRATAVLFLDLDGFKEVNDVHGHVVGDRVLAEVAGRLLPVLRSGDVFARHGGDEFVAVLTDLDIVDAERVACRVAAELLAVLRPVVGVDDSHVVRIGASIGIATSAGRSRSGVDLLHAADIAMYEAKAAGRGGLAQAGAGDVRQD